MFALVKGRSSYKIFKSNFLKKKQTNQVIFKHDDRRLMNNLSFNLNLKLPKLQLHKHIPLVKRNSQFFVKKKLKVCLEKQDFSDTSVIGSDSEKFDNLNKRQMTNDDKIDDLKISDNKMINSTAERKHSIDISDTLTDSLEQVEVNNVNEIHQTNCVYDKNDELHNDQRNGNEFDTCQDEISSSKMNCKILDNRYQRNDSHGMQNYSVVENKNDKMLDDRMIDSAEQKNFISIPKKSADRLDQVHADDINEIQNEDCGHIMNDELNVVNERQDQKNDSNGMQNDSVVDNKNDKMLDDRMIDLAEQENSTSNSKKPTDSSDRVNVDDINAIQNEDCGNIINDELLDENSNTCKLNQCQLRNSSHDMDSKIVDNQDRVDDSEMCQYFAETNCDIANDEINIQDSHEIRHCNSSEDKNDKLPDNHIFNAADDFTDISVNEQHNSIMDVGIVTPEEMASLIQIDQEILDDSSSTEDDDSSSEYNDTDIEDFHASLKDNDPSTNIKDQDVDTSTLEVIRCSSFTDVENSTFNTSDPLQLKHNNPIFSQNYMNDSDLQLIDSNNIGLNDESFHLEENLPHIYPTLLNLDESVNLSDAINEEDLAVIDITISKNKTHEQRIEVDHSKILDTEFCHREEPECDNIDRQDKTDDVFVDQVNTDNILDHQTVKNCKHKESGRDEATTSVSIAQTSSARPHTSFLSSDKAYITSSKTPKKYFCAWCDKYIQKFGRHLQDKHKDKPEVKEILDDNITRKEKLALIEKLRNEHIYINNYVKQDNKQKEFIVRRRTNKNKQMALPENYVPCDKCKTILRVSNIRHHYNFCKSNDSNHNRGRLVNSRKQLMQNHRHASIKMKETILPYMQFNIFLIKILDDDLVILYGNILTEKYPKPEDVKHIQTKLRHIGKFLWQIEQFEPSLKNLASVIHPGNIKSVVAATHAVAGTNEQLTDMRAPHTAKSIGTGLKSICEFLRRLYIQRQQHDKKQLVIDFVELLTGEFDIINRRAEAVYRERRRLKNFAIPSTDDISQFMNFLEHSREKAYTRLLNKFNREDWYTLGETTLLLIQVFNRRRQGEVSKMKIIPFKSCKGIDDDAEILQTLTDEEKSSARSYMRFVLSAKRDNDGVVLMKKEFVDSIELLLEYRMLAGVVEENPYVFGIEPTDGRHRFMEAYICMKKYANRSGVKCPDLLRGTRLRKHLATTCADKNLTDRHVEDLSRFMGHDKKIHVSHYRLREVRDIVKMPKLLESASASKFQANHDVSTESQSTLDDNSPETSIVINNSSRKQKKQNIFHIKKTVNTRKRIHYSESDSEDDQTVVKKKIKRNRWENSEITLILSAFADFIKNQSYPPQSVIKHVIAENPTTLKNRTVAQIKSWLQNYYKK